MLFCISVLLFFSYGNSQDIKIQKGRVIDSLMVGDSLNQSFALYLPRAYEAKGKWPIVFAFNTEGNGKAALVRLKLAAEKFGYILAASNNIYDTISISDNMFTVKRMMDRVSALFPLDKKRTYTAGYKTSGRFANLVPLFIKEVEGVISINASLANAELLSKKNPFHFIAIAGRSDFNYTNLQNDEKLLNSLKFPNTLLIYDESGDQTPSSFVEEAFWRFDLAAMAKGNLKKDSTVIERAFQKNILRIQELQQKKRMLLAERSMLETLTSYRVLRNTDSLREAHKNLKKDKLYRSLKRLRSAAAFKENLLRDDYSYYLEEDVLTYNFKNLGWWNFQMTKINEFVNGKNAIDQRMGNRLLSYLNALVDDSIALEKINDTVDEEALVFLLMLKTITQPDNFENYLNVVSLSAKNEDYGTSLFYLEEALKKGFKDKQKLYAIENTALFRITPEFNSLVKKYLDDSRYNLKE